MFCNGIYKDMASAFLVSAMSFIEHILFVSVPLMAPGLLCRPHKKCLRAVRRGPHFVLKHETTFFTPGSALRIRQVSLGWTRDSVSGLCQEPQAPGPIFAEVRPRETEPSSQGASAPRKGKQGSALQSPIQSLASSGFKYCPVYDCGTAAISSGVPVATMVPPRSPPSGPRSMI